MRPALLGLVLASCEPAVDQGFCDTAPLPVTWDNFGRSFVTERCQSCHGSGVTADDRRGAPEAVTFDNEEEVWMRAPQVLAVATGETAVMPPLGGVDADDRYLLEVWLTCGG